MSRPVSLAEEFPHDSGLIYLNHAGLAPWPRRAARAVNDFAAANYQRGAEDYAAWLALETRLRHRLARLVDAESSDDIALVANTSEGLSLIAYGLDWQPGDNVVINSDEFPSNRIVWESLAGNRGVEVRDVTLAAVDDPEGVLIEAMDARTRILPVSAVQYASGLRMDLTRLGRACRANGTLFCVDAIQELGARAMSARAIGADFLTADGHKWLLGPEGLGVLYVSPSAREALALHRYGWHMVEAVGDYARKDWSPASSARRFEAGSPNSLGVHALEASLSLLEEVGMATVEKQVLALSGYLIEELGRLPGVTPITPDDEARRAGIVTAELAMEPEAADSVYRELRRRRIVAAARGGGIRLSPHFYQDKASLDAALVQLDELVTRRRR